MLRNLVFATLIALVTFSVACESDQKANTQKDPDVVVMMDRDLRNIHPKFWASSTEKGISDQLFQRLIDLHPETYQPIPVLASAVPVLNPEENSIDFEIRENAAWHDGTPVTAKDLEFTLKFAFSPFLEQSIDSAFYHFIKDVIPDESNPRKASFILHEIVPDPVYSAGSLPIIPSHVHDPEGLFEKYTVNQFWDGSDEIRNDSSLKVLGKSIIEGIYSWDPAYLIGSGPYGFQSRVEGQSVTLSRIENYWGKSFSGTNPWFIANPATITYKAVSEPIQKKIELENQAVDLYRFTTSFLPTIKDNKSISSGYQMEKVTFFGFVYIGLNRQSPILISDNTRKAISFIINTDELIQFVSEGYGVKVSQPFFGIQSDMENPLLNRPGFNPDSCIHYLSLDGWERTSGSDLMVRMENGERQELRLRYVYSANNKSSEDTGLLLKQKAKEVGIEIIMIPLEFGAYIESMSTHDFDLTRGGIGIEPRGFSYSPLFHSSAIANGKNYVCFGDRRTDEILETLEKETDPEQINRLRILLSNELIKSNTWIIQYNPEVPALVSKKYTGYFNSPVFQGIWPPSLN